MLSYCSNEKDALKVLTVLFQEFYCVLFQEFDLFCYYYLCGYPDFGEPPVIMFMASNVELNKSYLIMCGIL